MEKFLIVSECFYSIQGEGNSMGYPAIFLRVAGCNLLCEGAGWRCDTIEVWKYGRKKLFEDVFSPEMVCKMENGAHLVITGGEPLLHQVKLYEFIKWFEQHFGFLPYIEVETNGTLLPLSQFACMVSQWNVSFKIASSGAGEYSKRINEIALVFFNKQPNAFFKIVIASPGDMLELVNDFFSWLAPQKFILMPAGETREQLDISRPLVIEAAMQFCLRYCDRLHIVNWNQKTGV